MKRVILFFLALLLCGFFFYKVDRMRQVQAPTPQLMLLPSREMTRVASFGNELLIAQLIFYNSMFFVGSLEKPPTLPTLHKLYHALDTCAYLDPYNIDTYYFAQGMFSWDLSLIGLLNNLLERGMEHRTWDWQLPFFYGFNQFYFMKNYKEGAIYLKKAYELNPKNTFLPTLIARLYYQADQTKIAVAFLEEMIRSTTSDNLRKFMLLRLKALQSVSLLESAIGTYEARYKTRPQSLEALKDKGILKAIPPDPYGGKFYLDKRGKVRTTSKFAFVKEKSSGGGK
jgi:tetratricopeptide (TPR) repeat protein